MREIILLNIFSVFATINALLIIFMTRSIGSILALLLVMINICAISLTIGGIYPAIAIFIIFMIIFMVTLVYSVIMRNKNHQKLELSVSNPKILKIIHTIFASFMIELVSVIAVFIYYPTASDITFLKLADLSKNIFIDNTPSFVIMSLLIFISIIASTMLVLRIRTEKIIRTEASEQFKINKEDEVIIISQGKDK